MHTMNTPLVSVIIPVYNVAPYLRQCLDSVCNQTLKNIEIICVDDGSTDESPQILEEYATRDSRIRILHQRNQYAGIARRNGMAAAKGRYLSFLDSDDFFEPDMMESMATKAEETNADIVACATNYFHEDTGKYTPAPWQLHIEFLESIEDKEVFCPARQFPNKMMHFAGSQPWTKLYRAAFIREYGIQWQAIQSTNDLAFVCTAIALARRVAIVNRELVHYRLRQDSISHTKHKDIHLHYAAFEQLRQNLLHAGASDEMMQGFKEKMVTDVIWHLNTLPKSKGCELLKHITTTYEPQYKLLNQPEEVYYFRAQYRTYKNLLQPRISYVFSENDIPLIALQLLLAAAATQSTQPVELIMLDSGTNPAASECIDSVRDYRIRREEVSSMPRSAAEAQSFCHSSHICHLSGGITRLPDMGEVTNALSSDPISTDSQGYLVIPGCSKPANPPLVSIIIPSYNSAAWLRRCMDSACKQTYYNLELLCVNDGSTDETLSIFREYAAKDPRIVIIDQENKGLGAARNAALRICKGEYVTGLDADDYLLPQTIETCMQHAEDDIDVIVYGIKAVADKDTELLKQFDYTLPYQGKIDATDEVLIKTTVNFVNKLWHRRLFTHPGVQFAEGLRYEDNLFYATAMSLVKTLYFEPAQMYMRYLHNDSIMGNTMSQRTMRAYEHPMVVEQIYNFLVTNNLLQRCRMLYLRFFRASHTFVTQKGPDNAAKAGELMLAYIAKKQGLDTLLSNVPFITNLIRNNWEAYNIPPSATPAQAPAAAKESRMNAATPTPAVNPHPSPIKKVHKFLGIKLWQERRHGADKKKQLLGITVYRKKGNIVKTPFLRESDKYKQYRFLGIPLWRKRKNR